MLTPAVQSEILQLHFGEHLSRRQIARQLRLDRKSVAKVLKRRQVLLDPVQRQRRSMLEPYYPRIEQLLEQAPLRSAVNILQRLRQEGYSGGITILRSYLRSIRQREPKQAYFRLDFAPGEAAQVDWGEFGDVFGDGTKVHVFVMTMCWSRMMYVEFTLRETLPALLRCYERALRFFGGRCRQYWHDNMATVVYQRLGRLVQFHPKFLAYAGFHGFEPIACNLGKGNEKGRVENGVKLVRYQFWPGRRFSDLEDLNRQAARWRDRFANRREHQVTGKLPELMWETEKPVLLPLRPDPYDTDDVVTCTVSHQYRVRFDRNTYTVPWTLAGKAVTVRGDDERVNIFYHHRRIASHRRCFLRGRDLENPAHAEGLRDRKAGASRTWELEAARSFGPHTSRYLELLAAGTRSLRSEVRELLALATIYTPQRLEETLGEQLAQGIVGTAHLERALRLSQAQPQAPAPLKLANERLEFRPPHTDLTAYDGLLLEAREDTEPEENA